MKKISFPIIILFIILNLAMIFTVDVIIFAKNVVKEFPNINFSTAFFGYPKFLKTNGLEIYDYINIAIVLIGFLLVGYGINNDDEDSEKELKDEEEI